MAFGLCADAFLSRYPLDYIPVMDIIIVRFTRQCNICAGEFYNYPSDIYNNIPRFTKEKGADTMQLTVREDHSEQFKYNTPGFPVYIGQGDIADFQGFSALAHWHDDLEFAVMLSGAMEYNVNGTILRVQEGEGIFINTRQVHFNFSREGRTGRYLCVLLHPTLLCSSPYVEDGFVAPVLADSMYPCQVFHRDVPWEGEVCALLRDIWERQEDPLLVQAAMFRVWSLIYHNAPISKERTAAKRRDLGTLQDMITYIQQNHREKLTLTDIARAGNVSRTTCHHIFKKYVDQSPNAYLNEYRLRRGMELLRSTDMTVAEICYETGFRGPSYFSESFRRVFGVSPMEFRKGGTKVLEPKGR